MKYCLLCCVLMGALFAPLRSEMDTLAYVILKDPIITDPHTLEFSLHLKNHSHKWNWWANGSFQFELPLNIDISTNENFEFFQIEDEAALINLSEDAYTQLFAVTDNSFIINIMGPDNYGDCVYVPFDSTISLGKYAIKSKSDIIFADSIEWKMPLNACQSCAYKAHQDSIALDDITWFKINDIIEMSDRKQQTICHYKVEKTPPPTFVMKYFQAEYIGNSIAKISWETESEAYNKGFSIRRAHPDNNSSGFNETEFRLIADYQTNPSLAGSENYHGKKYPVIFDTLSREGMEYIYILAYTDYDGFIHNIDTAYIFYPRSIISYAQPNPNPFSDKTTIEYIIEDDVIMNANVYDIKGREILKIMNEEYIAAGSYNILIENEQLHGTGFFELIIIAYPVKESSKYINKIVIPLHLVN